MKGPRFRGYSIFLLSLAKYLTNKPRYTTGNREHQHDGNLPVGNGGFTEQGDTAGNQQRRDEQHEPGVKWQ